MGDSPSLRTLWLASPGMFQATANQVRCGVIGFCDGLHLVPALRNLTFAESQAQTLSLANSTVGIGPNLFNRFRRQYIDGLNPLSPGSPYAVTTLSVEDLCGVTLGCCVVKAYFNELFYDMQGIRL